MEELSLRPDEAAEILRATGRIATHGVHPLLELAALGRLFLTVMGSNQASFADLDALVSQVRSSGDVVVDRKVEKALIGRARRILAKTVSESLKELFVPRWVFDSLERELRSSYERLRHKEFEIERLKRIIKSSIGGEQEARLYVATGLLEEYPAGLSDTRAQLICPWCKELNLIRLPTRGEVEATSKGGWTFRLHCQGCSKTVDLSPSEVLVLLDETKKGKSYIMNPP